MQMTDFDAIDVVAPSVVTLIAVVLAYSWSRRVRGGGPLTSFQKRLMWYGSAFVFGMTYTVMFHNQLSRLVHWKQAWIAIVIAWGFSLTLIAWYQYRRHSTDN
jgi:branched-subunit amino acid ABC-type transport system permease component